MSRIADALSKTRHSRHVRSVAPTPQVPWDFTDGPDAPATDADGAPDAAAPAATAPTAPAPAAATAHIVSAEAPPVVEAPKPHPVPKAVAIRSIAEVKPAPAVSAPAPVAPPAVQRGAPDERYAGRLLGSEELPGPVVEQYRALAATVVQNARAEGTRVLMVTSALPGEGKTLVASNLALTLSQSYRARVLLIDADLRRPCVHAVFGIPGSPGVTEWIGRQAATSEAPLTPVSENLTVMAAGAPRKDPMGIVSGPAMKELVQSCRSEYDWVILDTPPVGLLADAGLLAALADKVVLVVHAGRTPYDVIQKATDAVGPERILGVVLNQVAEAASDSYHYQYSNYYSGTP